VSTIPFGFWLFVFHLWAWFFIFVGEVHDLIFAQKLKLRKNNVGLYIKTTNIRGAFPNS
jgi:hypothetical protein